MTSNRRQHAVIATTVPTSLYTFQMPLNRAVRERGYPTVLISSPGTQLTEIENTGQAQTVAIRMARDISPYSDLKAFIHWLKLLIKVRPYAIICMTPKASLLGIVAAKLTGVPVRVYQCVGLRLESVTGAKSILLWLAEALTIRSATHVIANSPSLAQELAHRRLGAPNKITYTVSDHGVDTRRFSPQDPDPKLAHELGLSLNQPIIGFVGRLTKDKGISALLGALANAHNWPSAPQLLVVGSQSEPDSAYWLSQLQKLNISVAFTGQVADVRPFFALMTIHVLPSLREGFPNVVLEASAMAVPTVTTDATGCVDSVIDGYDGWVVHKNNGHELGRAIMSALQDTDETRRRGIRARLKVERDFQPEQVVSETLSLVPEL